MRRQKTLLVLLAVLMSAVRVMAQEVVVTVTPVQQVLPPQLLLYMTDPGRFFTITLNNTTGEDQPVYLGLQLEHVNPSDGLSISTPPQYQPSTPFVVPANGNYTLTTADMKNLFNHIPSQAMKIPESLVEGYMNGSFGLLPEGTYQVQFQAYKWKSPKYASPVACSNPVGGKNTFTVCYNATAPTFLTPMVGLGNDDLAVAEVDVKNPQFSWTQPVLSCNPYAFTYTYNIRFVELLEHQQPDVAMDHNPVVYERTGQMAPMFLLDKIVLQTKFSMDKTYIAQVTAVQSGASSLNYISLANEGKSPMRIFRFVDKQGGNEEEQKDRHFNITEGDMDEEGGADTLYKFRNPAITSPNFPEDKVRRLYKEADVYLAWKPAWYLGGVGKDAYDLKMEYVVEMFNGSDDADKEKTLEKEPIYTTTTTESQYTIPWDEIKDKVNLKDYVVLRVKPRCTNLAEGDSINFVDTLNVMDFTMAEHFSPNHFACTPTVEITNFKITSKKAADFEGKEIGLGEYQLTIDKIEGGNAEKGFTGRGRVKWELPIGTAMVHVKFDTLRINTEDVAIGGLASSYAEPKMSNYEAVENIFTDLGLEDMLVKAGVPYAESLQGAAKKTISDKIDGLANYYSLVKSASGIYDILTGGTADIYMPICLPKDKVSQLNSSPVDIQITTMKFAPTWATMDLLGEFTMPDSKCLASDLLVFGAPRLCISPDHIIPEAGTLALLDKFTVKDPNTDYTCTFNAPSDLLEPTDGCYVAWKDYKFEILGVDVDMKIPGLKKYDEKLDTITNELPNLKLKGFISSWDDFNIDEVTMDPFEAEDLPGFTFTASKIAYDHSLYKNCTAMSSFKFPEGYDKIEGVGEAIYQEHGLDGWEGLYIGEISVAMPKGISGTDGRLKIAGKNMLFDRSGVTLDADLEELIGAKVGDFSFEINRVGLSFIQNDFDNCHIDGKLTLPLLKGEKGDPAEIGLNCQIRKQIDDKGKKGEEFVYVFNTKSLNGDYMLDLFLAKLVLDDKLTYFLVEAEPQKNKLGQSELKTKCELLLGGKIEIGGKEVIEDWLKKDLGFKLSLPDIHFVGMRIANCKPWKSKYVDIQADIDKERAEQKKSALGGLYLEGKEFHNGSKTDGSDATFFFHTGSWSLASYKKQLGPFEFSLEDYKINKKMDGKTLNLGLEVTGKVALVKGIDISADVTLSILGKITNVGIDLSKIGCEFEDVNLQRMGVNASFCGIGIAGSVEFVKDGDNKDVGKGFAASLDITLPGDLFSVHGDGGYFDYDGDDGQYSWGWVHLAIGGKIELGPCAITKLGGGFYFNCSRNSAGDDKKPTRVAGLVGIFMELGMASPDGVTIRGDLTLNVVYNRKRKCLSSFNMTGNVKAVGGIINANMTLVYENSEKDRYLQINITADASLSAESMAGALDSFGANLGTIKDQMQQLAGDKFKDVITDCKQGLSGKIGAKAKDPEGSMENEEPSTAAEEDPATVTKNSKTSKQGGLPKMGAKISLDVKITWRAGGTEYKKPKWHVYLGEPAEDKRCTLTLIDFDSGIVDCHVGANAYICVGNELPNNGELPPLPAKIAKFLDGSKHGDFQSDNASQAQSARQLALQGFNGDISGGVMLGAMGYGDITINLGLIKGTLEAILGFDVSVVHYNNGYCVNLGKVPGYRGWYGKGQLYAYLYLLISLHFNLGFIDYDFDLASAEIGGVLKMGGPKPNYFQGKARAKISLLGGLFKFDKSFEFECGEYCQLFKGNPLDNFILFDDCTLGDTIRGKGWTKVDKNKVAVTADMQPKVKVNVSTPQYANTKAPIGEHFRLLDENELERIAGQFGEGSEEWEKSKMQAKRTFVFRDFGEVWLYEYDDPSSYTSHTPVAENASFDLKKKLAQEWCGAKKMYIIPLQQGGGKSRRYLDLGELRKNLKAGKFYRLVAAGYAKEIQKGVEANPYTYYNQGKNKGNIAWVKSTEYYFQTEPENIVNDKAPLQDYVAIAYPSHYNQLRSPESDIDKAKGTVKHIDAYLNDVQAPTIALTEDLSTKAFKNGKLYWRLLNPMGKQLDIVENAWVKTTNFEGVSGTEMVNMEPKRKLNAQAGEKYILQLDYYTYENVSDDEFNPNDKKWQTMDTTLVKLYVQTLPSDRDWRRGIGKGNLSCIYDQPFIAVKLTSVTIDRPYSGSKTDADIMKGYYYTKCPFTFISYMSNFVFPAGWEITERGFFNIEVTTSESMLFQDPGGGGKYEGRYQEKQTYRTHNAFADVKNTMVYTIPSTTYTDNQKKKHYYVPVQYPLSKYWHENGYGDWDYVHNVDDRIAPYSPSTAVNTDWFARAIFDPIIEAYHRVDYMNNSIHSAAVGVENKQRNWYPTKDSEKSRADALSHKKDELKDWYANHRGTYRTEYGSYVHAVDNSCSFFVPAYQFPVIWSICAAENISGAYKGMSNDNDRAQNEGPTWSKLTGMTWYEGYKTWITANAKYRWTYKEKPAETWKKFDLEGAKKLFKKARAIAYRVNAYDITNGHYYPIGGLLNGYNRFDIECTNPLTSDHSGAVVGANIGNTTGKSNGTSTGGGYVPVDTKVYTSTLTSSQLEGYLQKVKEMHDSCQVIYDFCAKYWPRYKSCAEKLAKAAQKAEKAAIDAVTFYANSSGNTARFETTYNNQKSNVTQYVKDARKWRDSVNVDYNWLTPDMKARAYLQSPVTKSYGYFKRSLREIATHLSVYMDRYITPQSDPNDAQYKRYRSMQDEANSWLTKLQEWYDEGYASYRNNDGYCRQAINQADWAEKEIKKMTSQNVSTVGDAYSKAYVLKNGVVEEKGYIRMNFDNALAKANEALADAKKKTSSSSNIKIANKALAGVSQSGSAISLGKASSSGKKTTLSQGTVSGKVASAKKQAAEAVAEPLARASRAGVPKSIAAEQELARAKELAVLAAENAKAQAERQATVSEMTSYINDMNAVLADYDQMDKSITTMRQRLSEAAQNIEKVGGTDGTGGHLKTIKDTFNDQCTHYKTTLSWYNSMKSSEERMVGDTLKLVQARAKLPSLSEIKRNLEAAKRKLDQASGRDTLTADRLMGRIDSLLAVVQKKLSKFESHELRINGYNSLMETYRNAKTAYKVYQSGDLIKVSECVDECKQFVDDFAKYKAYFEELRDIPPFIDSADDPVWDAFHEAGYDDNHDVVKRARQLWESENERANALNYLKEVTAWYRELEVLNAPGDPLHVPDMLRKAQSDLENPSNELLSKVGHYVVSKLTSLKYEASQFDTYVIKLTYLSRDMNNEFNGHLSKARTNWKDYEAAICHLHLTEANYTAAPKQCVINCEKAASVIGTMKEKYNSDYLPHIKRSKQLKAEAEEYFKSIPVDNPSVSNARQKYAEAGRIFRDIVDCCTRLDNADAGAKKVFEKTLKDNYNSEVYPLKVKAQQAIKYIELYHKPQLIPEVVIKPFAEDIKTRASQASTSLTQVNSIYRTSQTDYESFMTARNRMNSYMQEYLNKKKIFASAAVLRTALQNCIAQADMMIKLAPLIVVNCDKAMKLIDAEMSSFDDATFEMNYIGDIRTVDPSAFSTANRSYTSMKSIVSSLSSKRPTFVTRAQNTATYLKEAEQTKEKATSLNRNVGSSAVRR